LGLFDLYSLFITAFLSSSDPDHQQMILAGQIPNHIFPSDHIQIGAVFRFIQPNPPISPPIVPVQMPDLETLRVSNPLTAEEQAELECFDKRIAFKSATRTKETIAELKQIAEEKKRFLDTLSAEKKEYLQQVKIATKLLEKQKKTAGSMQPIEMECK
jgi:hypothetical protein